jgi:hypothetical protein
MGIEYEVDEPIIESKPQAPVEEKNKQKGGEEDDYDS